MAKSIKPKKLTQKQKQFCLEYIIDFNATQAAIRAGYSKKTAKEQGYENLTKPHIQEYVTHLIKERQIRTENKADDAMNECVRIALADVGEAFNDDGSLKSIRKIPIDLRKAISGFEVEEIWDGKGKNKKVIGQLKKVKFWSKNQELDKLFRHHGLYKEDNAQQNIPIKENLTEDQLKEKLKVIQEAGTGIDTQSIDGT